MTTQSSSLDALLASATQMRARIETNLQSFDKVGDVHFGSCERENVLQQDKVILYRYKATEKTSAQQPRVPLLICYAMVNDPQILDLQPDRSLIRGLLARGLDVYLIDWGRPDALERHLSLEHYLETYIHRCVEFICSSEKIERIHLLGVCQGGSLSLCYAALHPDLIQTLTTMVTPVDFHTQDNLLSKWMREVDLDALVETFGNIPANLLNGVFLALQPFRLMSQKYVNLLDGTPQPQELENFKRMERWIFDSPDQPGEMFRQFVRGFYQENGLIKGTLKVGDRKIDLRRIVSPVLNVYARQDHVVPPSASLPLSKLTGSRDYHEYGFDAGHIGIYVSRRAQQEIPELLTNWIRQRS
jgi:polyhydroxyalkanoate synthase